MSFPRLDSPRYPIVIAFSHLRNLIFQHPVDLVTHGFPVGPTEIHPDTIDCFPDLLYQRRCVLLHCAGLGRYMGFYLHNLAAGCMIMVL